MNLGSSFLDSTRRGKSRVMVTWCILLKWSTRTWSLRDPRSSSSPSCFFPPPIIRAPGPGSWDTRTRPSRRGFCHSLPATYTVWGWKTGNIIQGDMRPGTMWYRQRLEVYWSNQTLQGLRKYTSLQSELKIMFSHFQCIHSQSEH